MASYYDQQELLQTGRGTQTPPVPQMEYKPSKGAAGVQEMIQKLIQDAESLKADAVTSESEAQAAYEQTVKETNDSVAALQTEVNTKTKNKATATKDKLQAESDIEDVTTELLSLAKENEQLHVDCDYVLKNFGSRQR